MTKKPPQTSEEKEAASNNMGLGIGAGMDQKSNKDQK
ncbi:hypothetical protein IGI78_002224 [Enterococcus sp. DIV1767]